VLRGDPRAFNQAQVRDKTSIRLRKIDVVPIGDRDNRSFFTISRSHRYRRRAFRQCQSSEHHTLRHHCDLACFPTQSDTEYQAVDMAPALRTITPTLLSFALPLVLRVHHVSLHPIFLPLAIYAFVAERGYRETLEWVTPEFSEHTGPFSHIGVCLLAHMFVQDAYGAHGWRGEVLFWTVWSRWGAGVCRAHRAGIDVRAIHSP
jgi:hypothetical protein